jgi:hypothetical protein
MRQQMRLSRTGENYNGQPQALTHQQRRSSYMKTRQFAHPLIMIPLNAFLASSKTSSVNSALYPGSLGEPGVVNVAVDEQFWTGCLSSKRQAHH